MPIHFKTLVTGYTPRPGHKPQHAAEGGRGSFSWTLSDDPDTRRTVWLIVSFSQVPGRGRMDDVAKELNDFAATVRAFFEDEPVTLPDNLPYGGAIHSEPWDQPLPTADESETT